MASVTDNQIEVAKNVDLVSLCQANGIELFQREGERHQFRWVDHDSLVISKKKNIFKWWSRENIGGDAITFTQHVLGKKSFVEAVLFLNNQDYQQAEVVEEKQEPFTYFFKNQSDFTNANRYLLSRGIDEDIIECLHTKGFLQEVNRFDPVTKDYTPHLAFVWGKHGIVAGTTTQNLTLDFDRFGENGKDKPKIARNSEKDFGFNVTIGQPKTVYVFEGAVDLLSYWSLNKNLDNVGLLSMEGVKSETVNHYLNYVFVAKGVIPTDIYMASDNDCTGQRLNDVFYGKVYENDEDQTMTFHTFIPDNLTIPRAVYELYDDLLTAKESSLPINWLAAVHKVLTNFSDKHESALANKHETYFINPNPKETSFSMVNEVNRFIDDFDRLPTQSLEGVKTLLTAGKFSSLEEEHVVRKVTDYINQYDEGLLVVKEDCAKDWNDVLKATQPQEKVLNETHTVFKNKLKEDLSIEFNPSSSEDKKPYKASLTSQDKPVALFFEAESLKGAQRLAKTYGFYALDKEDTKKYQIKDTVAKQDTMKKAVMKRTFSQSMT